MKEGPIGGIIFFLKSSQISAYAVSYHSASFSGTKSNGYRARQQKTITENLSPVKIIYVLNFVVLSSVPRTKFITVEHPITATFLARSPHIDSCSNQSTTATFFCPQGSRYGEVQL